MPRQKIPLEVLQEIFDNEDKSKPLSDQKITEMLKARGMDVARRTVAKHRVMLGVEPVQLRRVRPSRENPDNP